jgi:hypothetical protein
MRGNEDGAPFVERWAELEEEIGSITTERNWIKEGRENSLGQVPDWTPAFSLRLICEE